MGLYIEGLRLPKKGKYTSFTVYSDGRVVFKFGGDHAGQAIEVPAHGPLVDALNVINAFPDEHVFTNEQARALTNYIIPAEEET